MAIISKLISILITDFSLAVADGPAGGGASGTGDVFDHLGAVGEFVVEELSEEDFLTTDWHG